MEEQTKETMEQTDVIYSYHLDWLLLWEELSYQNKLKRAVSVSPFSSLKHVFPFDSQ